MVCLVASQELGKPPQESKNLDPLDVPKDWNYGLRSTGVLQVTKLQNIIQNRK